MTAYEMMQRLDFDFEDGEEIRVEIPAAIYTTVRSHAELERVMELVDEYDGLAKFADSGVGHTDTVLYVGWGDETISCVG